jgi:hypothetical protein
MLYCFYLYIAKAEELETVNTARLSQSVFCLFIQFPSPFGVFFKRFQSLECHRAKVFLQIRKRPLSRSRLFASMRLRTGSVINYFS